jgi:hypothetical protein
MSSPKREVSYQCDRCGSPNNVALSLLHQRGTRSFTAGSGWPGSSQSYSAQAAAPPTPRRYADRIVPYGFLFFFLSFLTWGCYGALVKSHDQVLYYPIGFLLFLGAICLAALIRSCVKIADFNRDVFPRLHSHWAHTYACRRCGKLICILS